MTGRLIKHELKAGARRMSNIYIAAGIVCLAMLFSAFFKNGFIIFTARKLTLNIRNTDVRAHGYQSAGFFGKKQT